MSLPDDTHTCSLLPPELWDTILSNLCDDTASLGAYALTSHSGRQLATPYLFYDLIVSCKYETRNITTFIALIAASPHIARCIRNLTLRWRKNPYRLENLPHARQLDIEILLPILDALSNLRRLSVLVELCAARPERFGTPVINLDYLHLDWPGAHKRNHSSCTPVSLCCLLSLFGTIGELSITCLPSRVCTCSPLLTHSDAYPPWVADQYFHQMSLLPRHSLNQIGTAVTVLNIRDLKDLFGTLLVPKLIQSMVSLHALTSIALRYDHPIQFSAYGELLRLCGPRLLHCSVELEGSNRIPHGVFADIHGQCHSCAPFLL